jgi:hypothetical protein
MTTISLSTDIHIFFIILIALVSLAHLLVLRFENPYKVRRYTRYLLPVYHVFIASNIFTGILIMAIAQLALSPKYILMIIATVVLIALHIAINKALKWANPKDDEVFAKFKKRVTKILTYEFMVLLSTALVSPYL